jgi:hypothetical protein
MASPTLDSSLYFLPRPGRRGATGGMMTGDQYIQQVLASYTVSYATDSPVVAAANEVVPILQKWAGAELVGMLTCGSFAKRTAIAGNTDIDVLISLKPSAPPLQEVYDNLVQLAETRGWMPRLRNVSVGITFNGVKMDLVPGRVREGYRDYHAVWLRRVGSWTETNLAMHTERVRDSGRTREVRALKIWSRNHGLDFPSFYLELTVLAALARYGGDLAHNVHRALGYIADRLPTELVCDPANTTNRISDELSLEQKRAIAARAVTTYNATKWEEVLW